MLPPLLFRKHSHEYACQQIALKISACRACSAGKFEAVQYLVEEARASLESKDRMGATPLSVAAAAGEKNIALFLISKGADVEVCLLTSITTCEKALKVATMTFS